MKPLSHCPKRKRKQFKQLSKVESYICLSNTGIGFLTEVSFTSGKAGLDSLAWVFNDVVK